MRSLLLDLLANRPYLVADGDMGRYLGGNGSYKPLGRRHKRLSIGRISRVLNDFEISGGEKYG